MFKDIQAHVESGNDINSFYEDKSVLYEFLDYYYQLIIYDPINDDEDYFAEELLLPLAERSYDIVTKLQWMFENGVDPNAGGEWVPLMPPVAFLDYAMTEFLA